MICKTYYTNCIMLIMILKKVNNSEARELKHAYLATILVSCDLKLCEYCK